MNHSAGSPMSSAAPPTRTLTVVSGDQPVAISPLAKVPDRPNATHESSAQNNPRAVTPKSADGRRRRDEVTTRDETRADTTTSYATDALSVMSKRPLHS